MFDLICYARTQLSGNQIEINCRYNLNKSLLNFECTILLRLPHIKVARR